MKITTLEQFNALGARTKVKLGATGQTLEVRVSEPGWTPRLVREGFIIHALYTDEDVAVLQIETIPEPMRQGEARRLEDGRYEFLNRSGEQVAAIARGGDTLTYSSAADNHWFRLPNGDGEPVTPETFDALLKLLREENK